jgi:hypothetical protein
MQGSDCSRMEPSVRLTFRCCRCVFNSRTSGVTK